jgi:hypothetical protein
MMRWFGLSALLWLLSACDVTSVMEAPDTIARNECQSNADCGGGTCSDQRCRSTTPALQSVLFEVTPPADGSDFAGVQFLIPNPDLSKAEGDLSLALGSISQVVGRVTAEGRKCPLEFVGDVGNLATTSDFSVPARVSLMPTSSALGLYSPRVVVQSSLIGGSYWGFSMSIAPGMYDIYVEPGPQPDQKCPVPPQLLRGQELLPGTPSLKIGLPEPSLFEFHVTWPLRDGALNGWTVDMLDPESGRVISSRVPVALAKGSRTDYVARLSYNPVVGVGPASTRQRDQLLRLSPPDGLPEDVALPTVLLARSALGLFSADRGTLSEFSSLPTAVHVRGQVTSGDTSTPVAATVTLVAQKITGIDPGVLASFVRTVNVGNDGKFDVHLLPGTYLVSTVPQASLDPRETAPRAGDTREWIVPSTPDEQAGRVIQLREALMVSGQVLDASGDPVVSAQVQAVASPLSVQTDALQRSLTGAPFVPRASAGDVSSGGEFSLKTDPGTFDISVRPNANTGFAWLVMPNVPVTFLKNGVGLKSITMPLPVSYRGTVTQSVDGPAVPGALVRAYVYLKAGEYTPEASGADSVVQVAETRADKFGAFDVLIPAELNRLPD